MNLSRQLTQSAIWIAALLTSGILILFAYNMYPVPDGDSIFFLPAIKAYASTGIVDNKVVDLSFDTDPRGLGRFLFYTPGFPVLTGSAMALFGLSSYKGVLLFVSFARAASVLLLAQAIAILLKKYGLQHRPFYALFASLIIFSSGLFLFASNGRPESISMLVVSIGILVAVRIRSKLLKNSTLAICIGALYPVSIANGIIASVFYLFYLFSDVERLRTRIAFVALALASGLLFFAISYAVAGLPLVDGLRGLSLHSKMQLGRDDTGLKLIVSYWKSWILFAILSLIYLIFNLRSVLESRRSPLTSLDRVWLASSFAALIYSVYFFGARAAPIHYNLYAFLPLYQFLSFRILISLGPNKDRLLRYSLSGVVSFGLFLSLVDPLRAVALFPYYLTSGSTYDEAKENLSRLPVGECALMHTGGLAVLDDLRGGSQFKTDDAARVLMSQRIEASMDNLKCVVAIVQEVNSNFRAPVDMVKIADYSDSSPWTPRLKSLRFLNSPKGYSFNAYRREFPL